ncbi:LOW QUALITY PROTEIN: Hypothetical protein PHPALM_18649, partial [Phytophthora palmivora]
MKYDYGSEMWEYLCERFEGRENDTTKLYTQRTLRQRLESASCRPGSDVENHLLYMMGLREQLAALDADVGDVWMVDLMIRSMAQLSYYSQLQTMMLMGGIQTVSTPDQAKSLILVLDKNATVEKQLQRHRGNDVQAQRGQHNEGDNRVGSRGKPMPKYQNHNQIKSSGGNGNSQKTSVTNEKKTDEEQKQYDEDRKSRSCYGCHQPGHIFRNCPDQVKKEPDSLASSSSGNVHSQANFTVSSGMFDRGQQKPTQNQRERDQPEGTLPQRKITAKRGVKPTYRPELWVFDNGATQHLAGDKRYFVKYRNLSNKEREMATVHGYNGKSSPIGIGSIDLWVQVQEGPVVLRVDNVYYSPNRTNLFSQSVATEQGFQVAYDDATRGYTLSMNGAIALEIKVQPCKLWMFVAENDFLSKKKKQELTAPRLMVNYAVGDGVADLQCWHERLGHKCPQFVKQMADRGLVEGMTLRNRKFDLCEACQLGKQRAKTPQNSLDRGVKRRNQLVFADLLFPPSHYNCTRFKAILVVMDAHTRFVTAYPVQSKEKESINPLLKRYIIWAERQWPDCKVNEVLTDGGGEFLNDTMTTWYQSHGIIHTTIPKNVSRLNMVERTHQTLTGMMKSMMKEAGFPTSFWVEALHYAVYLKNRTFSSATDCTPYECMWERRPDIHHVRKFGALVYAHTKVGPSRHKFADNCRIGFVLGYRDGLLGCKVYFPTEGTVQVAGEVTVNEQILYKDRHKDGFDDQVRDWAIAEHPDLTSSGRNYYDLSVVGGGKDPNFTSSNGEASVLQRQSGGACESSTPWFQRPLPSFSDDVVLHPSVYKKNVPLNRQQDEQNNKEVDAPETNKGRGTVNRSVNEEPSYYSEEENVPFHNEELMMDTRSRKHNKNQLVDENVIRGKKKVHEQHPGLVEVVDSEEPEIEVDDLQLRLILINVFGMNQKFEYHVQLAKLWLHHNEQNGGKRELAAMEEKDVLELVPENDVPDGTKILETMWRFQAKTDELGNILRYRPRLCGRGDKEVPGVDFNVLDTFSPVARMASFRVMIALCKIFKLLAFQCDINTAYLNARRKVVRYIRRIAGFPIKPGWVYKVKNALYGLHESGREWYDELHGWLTAKGLQRTSTEPCLYYYIKGETIAL